MSQLFENIISNAIKYSRPSHKPVVDITYKEEKNDEHFSNIPVIIYSTSINPFEKEKCMRLGAHSYIRKPITFSDGVATAKTFHAFCNVGSVS